MPYSELPEYRHLYRPIEGVSPEEAERLARQPKKDFSRVLQERRRDIDLNALPDEEILEHLSIDYQDVYDYYGGSEGY